MFEASLVDDAARTARPYTVSFSLVMQVVAAAIAVAYPLLHIEALPIVKLRAPSPFVTAIALVDPAPAQTRPRIAPPTVTPFRLPPLRPRPDLPAATTPTIDAPQFDAGPSAPFAQSSFPGPTGPGAVIAVRPPVQSPPAPVERRPIPVASGPVKVGGNVRPPQLIREIKPAYPQLAVQTRTQGMVKIEAIISRDGFVRDARVVSGHPLLVAAALDAVRQWRYRPTILNDQPVEVALALEVNFTLSR